MNRFDKCECGDTFGRHDDNEVCRVKDCICTKFKPVINRVPEFVLTVHGGN